MNSSILTYCKKNKTVLLLLFIWLFRICFLTQENRGSVAINKYVIIQIITIFALALYLYGNHLSSFYLLKYNTTKHFTILYIFGMFSVIWSIFPGMSLYFAFENLVCLTAVLYLSINCTDVFQLERIFIYIVIFIISMFLVKNIVTTQIFHSVTYSSIAAMLTMYCLPELYSHNRTPRNSQTLKLGLVFGIFILIITSSSGAIFSTFLAMLVFLLQSQKTSLHTILFLFICIVFLLLILGYQQRILAVLFPNKSTVGILSAHGRTVVWGMINEKVAMKPLLGWGYAAVDRILPIYCTDAHNSIIGVRGSLGNIGCIYLIISMLYLLLYLYSKRNIFGYKGIFFAILCGFINSNTYNFLAGKAGSCSLTFHFLLVLGAVYHVLGKKKLPVPQSQADLNEVVNDKR